MRRCPFCAEPIQATAIVCKHCKSSVQQANVNNAAFPSSSASMTNTELDRSIAMAELSVQNAEDSFGRDNVVVAERLDEIGSAASSEEQTP